MHAVELQMCGGTKDWKGSDRTSLGSRFQQAVIETGLCQLHLKSGFKEMVLAQGQDQRTPLHLLPEN